MIVARLRSLLRVVAPRLKHWAVWVLMLLTPRQPHIVIFGYPASEGNAIEMVRATANRYPGRIFYLTSNPEIAQEVLKTAGLCEAENIVLLQHHSLSGLLRFATAELVMFTHGIYGYPRRTPRKVLVNLWHGGGIKAGILEDDRGRPLIHSDFLIAATRWKGESFARQSQLPARGLLLTGNPRIDQFGQWDTARLSTLGIDPGRPFVVWMPTFRKSRLHPSEWQGGELAETVNSFARTVVKELANVGIQTVVKPHPSDAESRDIEGGITVTNDMLVRSGVFVYHLLGASDGLLTDYSSVWIDYLTLDRPIGFVVPDEETYRDQRGFDPPDALEWLPGPRIHGPADIVRFAEDVRAKGAITAQRRREVANHIGLVVKRRVADHILDELEVRGAFIRGLRPSST